MKWKKQNPKINQNPDNVSVVLTKKKQIFLSFACVTLGSRVQVHVFVCVTIWPTFEFFTHTQSVSQSVGRFVILRAFRLWVAKKRISQKNKADRLPPPIYSAHNALMVFMRTCQMHSHVHSCLCDAWNCSTNVRTKVAVASIAANGTSWISPLLREIPTTKFGSNFNRNQWTSDEHIWLKTKPVLCLIACSVFTVHGPH